MTFRDKHGARDYLETSSSAVLFARLHACAVAGHQISFLIQGGRELGPESVAALNCYLRSYRIGRGGLPWHKTHPLTRTKYDWRAFVAHLELVFR